jgi:hypothetical protein
MIDLRGISQATFDDGIDCEVSGHAAMCGCISALPSPRSVRGRPTPSAMISARPGKPRSRRTGATRSMQRP